MRKNVVILALFFLALAPRASAQVTEGDSTLSLNAAISAGYTDDYTNTQGSDHSIGGAGVADLNGFYHNPNFLSFQVQPFYNQSRLNSNFQSITAASGVSASANIFGGSEFPGSVSYSTTYNGSGNFNVPGLANYTTHGNNDIFAVNWGVRLHDLPSLNLSFSDANSDYSVYGENAQGKLHSLLFSATSTYQIAGFNLNGGYQYAGNKTFTPEFLVGEVAGESDTATNSFFFGIGHVLPAHGSFSASANHVDLNSDFGESASGDNYNTSIDTLSASLSFAPERHLQVGANTYYTDNLAGTLYNTLLSSGVVVPESEEAQSSHSLSLTGYGNYEMPEQHLDFQTFFERQQQSYLGISIASDAYNGTATYSNTLLGGSFTGVLGLTRTTFDTTHESTLGVITSVNYTHQLQRWSFGGGFGYSQGTQTALIAYTASGYNYNASVGRHLGRKSHWGAYASGAKSYLSDEPGSANESHSYSTSLSLRQFSIDGSYSMSSGNALLTATGLVSNPLPLPAVNPASVVLFNGKSFSVGAGSNPIRGLTLTALYSKSLSMSQSIGTNSNNNSDIMSYIIAYNFRKLNFNAGYSRLLQGFTASGTPPALVGSFYVGVMRWFNFF